MDRLAQRSMRGFAGRCTGLFALYASNGVKLNRVSGRYEVRNSLIALDKLVCPNSEKFVLSHR